MIGEMFVGRRIFALVSKDEFRELKPIHPKYRISV